MEINDILLDALGGLFCPPVYIKKTSVKKNSLLINMQIFEYLKKIQYIMIIMNLIKLKKKKELIIYY